MANHPVVITSTAAQAGGSVIERIGLTGDLSTDQASQVIDFTDADVTDAHRVVSVVPQGASYLGSFTLGAISDSTGGVAGSLPWAFSVPDGALDFLAAGQTLVQRYAVTIGDLHNGPATQIVTVTLTGTNDPTVIDAATTNASGSVIEQAAVTGSVVADSVSGKIGFTDADITDTHKVVGVVSQGAGYLGTLTLGAIADSTGGVTGAIPWTFSVPDGALDFLAAGQTLVQKYTVTIGDLHNGPASQVVTVTLTGTNDAPVIAGVSTGSVTEDVPFTARILVSSGTLTIADADLGQAGFITQAGTAGSNGIGVFTLDAAGHWTYAASDVQAAIQQLGAGQSLTDSFTATSLDGTKTQLVTVTVSGTNDVPQIGGVIFREVHEDLGVTAGNLVTSGTLTIADADLGQSSFVTQTATAGMNGLGTFTLDTAGHWTYAASNAQTAIQQLALGEQRTDSFYATSFDGTQTQLVTVSIIGANDVPVIGGDRSGAVTEDVAVAAGYLLTSGALTIVDVDQLQSSFQGRSFNSTSLDGGSGLGFFSLDTTGHWTYYAWNAQTAIQQLGAGQSLTDSFIALSHDGTRTRVTVALHGTNDPVEMISSPAQATGFITEQAGITASPIADIATGTIAFKDADLTDTHRIVSVVPQGAGYLGSFTLGALADSTGGVTGSIPWTFSVADGALDLLAAGQTLVQSYAVTIGDFHNGPATQIVTVTLTGANDPTLIDAAGTAANGSITEHAGQTGSLAFDATLGIIAFTDTDLIDKHFVASVVPQGPGYVGALTFEAVIGTAGGAAGLIPWIFSAPDGALDFLAAGQTVVQSYSVTVDDGHGGAAAQIVTVTLTGTNDAPVANADLITVTAGSTSANLWTSLLANDTDIDTAHTALTISSVNTTGTAGSVTLNPATHALTYHAPAGGVPDGFQYTVSDGQGGSSTATVGVNAGHLVNGGQAVDDNWVVSPGQTATFSSASVLANDTAAGGGPLTLLAVSGPNASLSGGVISYASPGVSDSFTYTTLDGHGTLTTGTVNVSVWNGSSTPVGGAANQAEWLVGSGSGSAPITMIGTAVADHLEGSVGNYIITGGGGADTLTGGAGFNQFIYNNAGTIGAGASNSDSSLAAMDRITNFVPGIDTIELNGFGFSPTPRPGTIASPQGIGGGDINFGQFTSGGIAGYFADGNVIHVERQALSVSEQIYIDANKDGSFEAANDIVIKLTNFSGHLSNTDFQFH
jgi:VCBS repeat-containing protein